MKTLQYNGSKWMGKCVLFLSGQTVTLFGSSLVQFAINWHITLTTQSGLMLTIATICGFLPQIIISFFAGAWADRLDRKKMIILADGLIAVSTAVLAVLFTAGFEHIWLLFIISAIRSLGTGIQTPAVNAVLPDIVPEKNLMRVNGAYATIQGFMMLVSPAAALGIYEFLGLNMVFWVDVLTAAVGISLLMMLHIVRKTPLPTERPHVFRDMWDGIRYVTGTGWLRQFLGFYLIYSLMFGPVVFLTPLMVTRSFGEESWRLMTHEMVFAFGMTVGGIVASIVAGKIRNKVRLVIIACAVFGGATLVMGFSPNFWFYLGIMLAMGITIPFVNSGSMTVLQTRVQPELMGRVFGLVSLISSVTMPLSMVIFGPLADIKGFSIEALLILTGVFMALIALLALRARTMMTAGESLSASEAIPEV